MDQTSGSRDREKWLYLRFILDLKSIRIANDLSNWAMSMPLIEIRKAFNRKIPRHSNFDISVRQANVEKQALGYVRLKLRGEVWVGNMDLGITDILQYLEIIFSLECSLANLLRIGDSKSQQHIISEIISIFK